MQDFCVFEQDTYRTLYGVEVSLSSERKEKNPSILGEEKIINIFHLTRKMLNHWFISTMGCLGHH